MFMRLNLLIPVVFALAIALPLRAQQSKKVDSLLLALDNHPQIDSMHTVLLHWLGREFKDRNNKKALEYFLRAIEAGEGVRNKKFIANRRLDAGYCYQTLGEFEKSVQQYLAAASLYEQVNSTEDLSNAYLSMGNVYNEMLIPAKALEYFRKSEQVCLQTKDSVGLGYTYSELGIWYQRQGKSDTADSYYAQALAIARARNDTDFELGMLSNIGLMHKQTNNTEKAKIYLGQAEKLFLQHPENVETGAALYNNIASTYVQAGEYAAAKKAFDKSLALAYSAHSRQIQMENYRNLAQMYEKQGDHKQQALYLQKHYALKDSLFTDDLNNKVTALESDYQLQKKNAEILRKDVQVTRATNTRNLLFMVAGIVALIAAGFYYYLQRSRKVNALLEAQNQRIQQQNTQLAELNLVKDRLFSTISHDLRNPLVTLQAYLSMTGEPGQDPARQAALKANTQQLVSHTTDMLDNMLVWAQSQIKNTPPSLLLVDLQELTAEAGDGVQLQAARKHIEITNSLDTNATQAIGDMNLLRIIFRNLLTNAVKFTPEAGKISITSRKADHEIQVSITDTGVGMSKEELAKLMTNENETRPGTAAEKGTGMGLFLVKEFLQKLNGKLVIESEPGKGSTFTVVLPAV
jgi:two-component system, sensor histidine kinase and response regulator